MLLFDLEWSLSLKSTIFALTLCIFMFEFWEMFEMDILDIEESKMKKGSVRYRCYGIVLKLYCLAMCYELLAVDYFSYFYFRESKPPKVDSMRFSFAQK